MALFLVQHGKSFDKDVDPERHLSPDGIDETGTIAQMARKNGIVPKKILHSGKKRARQTADIFAEILDVSKLEKGEGLGALDDVGKYAKKIKNKDQVMLVGHLPFIEKLASFLITGKQEPKVVQFQNSGIVCLDSEDGHWFVSWTIQPVLSLNIED